MSTNYSLYAVPATWGVAMMAHWYAASLTFTSNDLPAFQNVHPRLFLAKCQALEKQSPVVAKFLRAEAANMNGMEQIGIVAFGVLAGNFAKLPVDTLNFYAGLFVATRVLFTVLYINTTSPLASYLRSLTFISGVGATFALVFKAATAINARA